MSTSSKAKSSDITPDTYRVAAQEHVTAAVVLLDQHRFVLAHYVAGLGVECMIRAYRTRLSSTFDERHDLYELARAARFFDLFPAGELARLTAAFGTVTAQWLNTHRFRSEASLRKFLTERKLYHGIKGDLLTVRSRMIVNAALELVSLGASKWRR